MFYSEHRRSVSELMIHGSCDDASGYSPVIGRLIFGEGIKSFSGKEALLAVVCGDADRDTLEDPRTVGVVRISDRSTARSIPCPCLTVSELPRSCDGRIALLDPVCQRLFVSPDIATVNKYLPRLCERTEDALPSVIVHNGKRLTLSVVSDGWETSCGMNILLPALPDEGEEELYLRISEIAEQNAGRGVTVCISKKNFRTCTLRAILRGAVWGELSLLICDLLTESELTELMREYCRIYCELEGEGREFNGYIRRGLCIASPHLLSVSEKLHGVDFFIYDIEKLSRLVCGDREDIPDEVINTLLTRIGNISDTRKDLSLGVILGEKALSPHICRHLRDKGVSYFAASRSHIKKLCRTLKE